MVDAAELHEASRCRRCCGSTIGLWKYAATVASSPSTWLSTWPSVCIRRGKIGSISASQGLTSAYAAAMPPVAV